jgi:hypothetical protein
MGILLVYDVTDESSFNSTDFILKCSLIFRSAASDSDTTNITDPQTSEIGSETLNSMPRIM